MVNIFPNEIKEELIGDYRRRRAVVGLSLLFIVCLIGIALLASFYLTLYLEERSLDAVLDLNENEAKLQGVNELNKVARETNRRSELVTMSHQPSFQISTILQNTLDLTGRSVDLNSYSFVLKDESLILAISGVAQNRAALVSYTKKLERDPLLSKLDSPVSNLIQDADTNFSLTLTFEEK